MMLRNSQLLSRIEKKWREFCMEQGKRKKKREKLDRQKILKFSQWVSTDVEF